MRPWRSGLRTSLDRVATSVREVNRRALFVGRARAHKRPAQIEVALVNNYDMRAARLGVRAGTYPSHHLYGTSDLPHPFVVLDPAFRPGGFLTSLSARLPLGELDQQWEILRARANGPSLVLAANAATIRALSLLRAAHVSKRPVVAVVHGAPRSHVWLQRAALRGVDLVVTLSHSVARELREHHGVPANRLVVLPWGPDLSFFGEPTAPAPDGPVVSLGKSARDSETLMRALSRTPYRGRIYSRSPLADVPPNVEVLAALPKKPALGPATYDHVLADLRMAAVIAIPLQHPSPFHGLTELGEAMACGKPVLMTRVPYLDIDIEAIGCGIWIDPGDVDGWERALRAVLADPKKAEAMGRLGRQFAEREFNAATFAEGMAVAVKRLMGRA